MPQMNPIWWLPLFIMFSLIFIISNSLNYFYLPTSSTSKYMNVTNIKKMNWKW